MLQEKLQPLIAQIQGQSDEDRSRTVHDWFTTHPENVVGDPFELPYLCELPNDVRRLVTYPVIGNLVLSRMNDFQPESEYQSELREAAKKVVKEKRFHNHHTGDVKPLTQIQMETELIARMLERPEESRRFYDYMIESIERPFADIVYDQLQKTPGKTYTTDFGHGIFAPLKSMTYFVMAQFEYQLKNGAVDPLDKVSMVVDDAEPEYWHGLLRLAGFREIEGQPGYFRDGESALLALESGGYDIILTDLELGEDKMDGVAFAQTARKVQLAKGKPAMIALFSYNKNALHAAQVHGYHYPSTPQDLFFEQPDLMCKSSFSPFQFRSNVRHAYRKL